MTDSEKLVVARLLAAIRGYHEAHDPIPRTIEDVAPNGARTPYYEAAHKRRHYTRLALDAAVAAAAALTQPAPVQV